MKDVKNEQGFVLVAALLVMLVLTILGISTTTNTTIELQIAGNDKVSKITFYEAEGGAMLGSELLEQNYSCPGGFTTNAIVSTVWARIKTIGDQPIMDAATLQNKLNNPTTNYDAAYSLTGTALTGGVLPALEVGYLYYGGSTNILPGGALQMAAGYEGKGKASAQGGVAKLVDIYSQFKGLTNSESIILYGWRHMIGSEGNCIY